MEHDRNMDAMSAYWFIFYLPCFIFAPWFIALFGWAGFAKRYATTRRPIGDLYLWASGKLDFIAYRGCLNVWISEDGLFLEPSFLFRLWHKRLLIPWRDLSPELKRDFWMTCELKPLKGSIKLYGGVGIEVLAAWDRYDKAKSKITT